MITPFKKDVSVQLRSYCDFYTVLCPVTYDETLFHCLYLVLQFIIQLMILLLSNNGQQKRDYRHNVIGYKFLLDCFYHTCMRHLLLPSMSWYLGNFVIPSANRSRVAFEEKYFYHRSPYTSRHIHKQVSKDVLCISNFLTCETTQRILFQSKNSKNFQKLLYPKILCALMHRLGIL